MTTSFQRKLRYMNPSRAETKTHHDQETGVRGAGSDQEREEARLAGTVRNEWRVRTDREDAEGGTQLAPRLNDEDRLERCGGANRRGDDCWEVGFRGRRVRELAGRGVALALGRWSLIIVADLSEGQDRQCDHDRDEASPHTDIVVRRQAGVKEVDARK